MNRLGEHTQHVGHLNDAPFVATRDSKGCLHNVPVVMPQLEEGLIHGLIFFLYPQSMFKQDNIPFFSMGIR